MNEIVKKVWGTEQWIVNREYCGKLMTLKKDYYCSTHKHKKKDETFYVLSGTILFNLAGKESVLTKGSTIHIPRGKYHKFLGITNAKFIEFSTHHEESDSYRKNKSGKLGDDKK